MTTLAQVTLNVAAILRQIDGGTATGGSTTTLADSLNAKAADYYNGGTIWFLSGANAGKSAEITDFGSGTFTFATQSGACAAGNVYRALNAYYTRAQLIQAVNQALMDIDSVPMVNDDLASIAGQEEYALPSGVSQITRVLVSSNSSDPYDWEVHRFWKEINGVLYLKPGKTIDEDDRVIRLHYQGRHGTVAADTDVINPAIAPVRLTWAAAYYAALAKAAQPGLEDAMIGNMINVCYENKRMHEARHPIASHAPDARLANY